MTMAALRVSVYFTDGGINLFWFRVQEAILISPRTSWLAGCMLPRVQGVKDARCNNACVLWDMRRDGPESSRQRRCVVASLRRCAVASLRRCGVAALHRCGVAALLHRCAPAPLRPCTLAPLRRCVVASLRRCIVASTPRCGVASLRPWALASLMSLGRSFAKNLPRQHSYGSCTDTDAVEYQALL